MREFWSSSNAVSHSFVTYTRAFMADMAKRSLDGTTAVTTEYANIQLETPLRVDVYVPYEQLPAKVTPLLPVNALPPKPLLVCLLMLTR